MTRVVYWMRAGVPSPEESEEAGRLGATEFANARMDSGSMVQADSHVGAVPERYGAEVHSKEPAAESEVNVTEAASTETPAPRRRTRRSTRRTRAATTEATGQED